jgi:LemA protein
MTPWILGTVGVLVASVFLAHNKLQRYRVECSNAWSHVDIQLARRHDLIPRLVETVRSSMEHESSVLTQVTASREEALASTERRGRLEAETGLSNLLNALTVRLKAMVEQVPSLSTGRNALLLQEELEATENRIAYTRAHYNDIVSNYNTLCERLPTNLVAALFGFEKQLLFPVPDRSRLVVHPEFRKVEAPSS